MAQPRHVVRVDAGEDAEDLLQALSVRGFEARRLEAGEIELETVEEEPGIWNIEVVSALESWLDEEGRDELVAHVGDAEYTVRAPHARVGLGDEENEAQGRGGPSLAVAAAVLGAVLLLAAGIWVIVAAVLQTT